MSRKMKDSGVEWIGEIPEEWTIDKMGRIFKTIGSGTTPRSDDERSFCGNIHWIQSGDITGTYLDKCKTNISEAALSQYTALRVYKSPFIIVAMYGASIGNASISSIDACVNQACCVLGDTGQDLSYLFYAIKLTKDFFIWKAVGGGQPNISQEIIRQTWLPMPREDMQREIASFLDNKTAQIDAIIEKTRASIEEYKKLKQAIITQAVTKGVRGERKMKDSGIEWIGEIPEEWNALKLKFLCEHITDGSHFSPQSQNEGYPYITAKDIQGIGIDYNKTNKISAEDFLELQKNGCRPHKGDVLLVKDGATTGRTGLMIDDKECVLLSSVAMLTPKPEVVLDYFLMYLVQSDLIQNQINLSMAGSAMPRITLSKLVTYHGLFCPLDEQEEIIVYLDDKIKEINTMILRKEQFLLELESYKKSLIYEYVTGKKEVPA